MTRRVLTATPATEVREAARIHALPVLTDGILAEILTSTDIFRAVVVRVPLDLWI